MLSFVFMATLALATDCNSAKNSLDDFLSTLPRSCRVDADCTGRYYRANSCAAPVVTNKAPLLLSKEKQLLALQAQVRNECRTQQPGPACSPTPFLAQCVKNSCTDAIRDTATDHNGEYSFGTIRSSCAPWDGSAVALTLTQTAKAADTAPRLQISVYRSLQGPLPMPLTFDLKDQQTGGASRCRKSDKCEAATSGTVTFTSFEEGKGASGTYDIRFNDGTIERGKFNLRWENVRALCG
jgi:hypothetical protein